MNIPKKIEKVLPVDKDRLIVFMKFGSHLYGTNTPESDTDYNGIYMPTREEVLLNKVPKAASYHSKKTKKEGVRNDADDIDIKIYSLHYFMELLYRGESIALDMIHAPDDWPLLDSDIWAVLRKNRRRFHTKSLKSFVGYARKQAAKYGVKGSRLATVKGVIEYMEGAVKAAGDEVKLKHIWGDLPKGDHIHKIAGIEGSSKDLPMYQVIGKKFGKKCKVSYVLDILKKFEKEYGHRARLAEKNEGIDWKAVSHAMRAALQVSELLGTGDIIFPLRQAELLKKIKKGEYDYNTVAAPLLEGYMDQCEKLSSLSNLPEKVNRKPWLHWLANVVENALFEKEDMTCPI